MQTLDILRFSLYYIHLLHVQFTCATKLTSRNIRSDMLCLTVIRLSGPRESPDIPAQIGLRPSQQTCLLRLTFTHNKNYFRKLNVSLQ